MNLKNTIGMVLIIASALMLLPFNVYWYLVRYNDISSFLSFSCVAICFIIIGILLFFMSGLESKVNKFKKEIEYFEEKLLDTFPRLRGR